MDLGGVPHGGVVRVVQDAAPSVLDQLKGSVFADVIESAGFALVVRAAFQAMPSLTSVDNGIDYRGRSAFREIAFMCYGLLHYKLFEATVFAVIGVVCLALTIPKAVSFSTVTKVFAYAKTCVIQSVANAYFFFVGFLGMCRPLWGVQSGAHIVRTVRGWEGVAKSEEAITNTFANVFRGLQTPAQGGDATQERLAVIGNLNAVYLKFAPNADAVVHAVAVV